ncbi:MAG: L,D-transpeptidase family protein [Gammaproteobacteria bacterium]|nr:L,D-transpeptidase family protein [Gammaproteobacteria bacterium]MBU1775256.1 L,D-transpeptidase family protein [Gammaproteobacteria bacterium]MBU1968473.1 L,D-transpeptidase family protein [Gammaproteobacteria bacterium]
MRNTASFLLAAALAFPAQAETPSRDMELSLAKSLQAVRNNRLDLAMNEVDSLLRTNPNFKLAQLVRGDLLLARSRPISDFGNAPNAPRERVQDLRDEAIARLQRVQQQQPIAVPKYLWQLSPKQRYAVVVDTSLSTLYLYENVGGEPRYVADFYISVGKKGADKLTEGDQKTPLGVYFVNQHLTKKQLTDFYGSGAYPISYPNEWDKRQGRNGHGIWLHGTPSDTYSRPPLASNGCVVLANDDLDHLGKHVQVGVTPVIITRNMAWSDDADRQDRSELLQAIEQWRNDWSRRDTERYLSHYSQDFSAGNMDLAAFAQQKRLVNSGKTWIKVGVSNLSVFPYPSQPDLVVVNFDQDYDSNNLSNRMHKRQYWMKRDGRWQIVYEGAA